MRRSLAILVWILLGALAASLGIGSVLVNAKQDREALERKLAAEETRVTNLQQQHDQFIAEANRTVEAAVRNASATRELLNAITEEQATLEQATPLVTSPLAKRWSQTISFPLGISIRTPSLTITTSTDTLIQSTTQIGGATTAWLSVTRYDQTRANDLTRYLSSAQTVNYRLNQTLITGTRGVASDGSSVFVLRTQRRGVATHLIWIKLTGQMTEARILDSLSTLLFATE